MATSIHFFFLTPQTLCHHSSTPSPSLLPSSSSSSLKPLQNLTLSSTLSSVNPNSRFICKLSTYYEVEDEEDDGQYYSRSRQQNFSQDLKLFVGNLSFDVDSAALAELFGQIGDVQMVEVIYDRTTGRSRGFGFVTMSTVEEVESAQEQFNGYEFEGRPLRVNSGPPPSKKDISSSPEPRSGSDISYKVHVGNLAWGVDNLTLETLFSDYGNVREAAVIYDRQSGRSRGFGYVMLSSPEEVESAISSLDGIDVGGRSIRVRSADARPRHEY